MCTCNANYAVWYVGSNARGICCSPFDGNICNITVKATWNLKLNVTCKPTRNSHEPRPIQGKLMSAYRLIRCWRIIDIHCSHYARYSITLSLDHLDLYDMWVVLQKVCLEIHNWSHTCKWRSCLTRVFRIKYCQRNIATKHYWQLKSCANGQLVVCNCVYMSHSTPVYGRLPTMFMKVILIIDVTLTFLNNLTFTERIQDASRGWERVEGVAIDFRGSFIAFLNKYATTFIKNVPSGWGNSIESCKDPLPILTGSATTSSLLVGEPVQTRILVTTYTYET